MTPEEVLAIPMHPDQNDAAASTIREYLVVLLGTLWEEEEGFSGKRPFGNSSWKFEVYKALMEGGAIEGKLDEDGYLEEVDDARGDKLVAEAIDSLAGVLRA